MAAGGAQLYSVSSHSIICLQRSNSEACSFDLKTIILRKVMMLGVGEPGELPLMRGLTVHRKSKATQDSTRKSPLLGAIPSSSHADEAPFLQPVKFESRPNAAQEEHDWYIQEDLPHGHMDGSQAGSATPMINPLLSQGAVSRSAKSPPSIHHFDPTTVRSPPMNDFNTKIMNWDSIGDASRQATYSLQRESLHGHLERLGILGGQASNMPTVDQSSLLNNWKHIDDRSLPNVNSHDNLEIEGSPHAWNRAKSAHASSATRSNPDNIFSYRDGEDVGQCAADLQNSSGLWQDAIRRSNTHILSPFVLNPPDDSHRFGVPYGKQPYFSLEAEHIYEDDAQDRLQHDKKERMWTSVGGRPQGQLSPHLQHRKQIATKYSMPFESNSSAFAFRPATSETEFFEYDLETLEQPSKGMDRPTSRMVCLKEHSYTGRKHAGYSFDNVNPVRRNTFPHEGRPSSKKQNQVKAADIYNRSRVMEPLCLSTELEDYNASDEDCGSSVDGDLERFSLNEHQRDVCIANRTTPSVGRQNFAEPGADRLQLAVRDCKELALCESQPRNLSQKYRPKAFEEVVGQPIVTQALSNAIMKGRIAPVYLFQGSRGTGKTTAARIFAAALVCIKSEVQRPCSVCQECLSVAKGINTQVKEVDAASNNGIERVKVLLEETISSPSLSRFKVFIIDECHVLTIETWNALLKILEEPPINVVFILITTDPDRLPQTVLSRCQKFPFPKIKDTEIIERLQKLASKESLSIDLEILKLIASRSDGSLRDAETTLDQITLLGHQVDPSTVHELVGCASDEKILSLLNSALVADTINTVRAVRDIIDSGMEPLSLMSRLATVITDILAGSFRFSESQRRGFFRKQILSEEKLERLRMAMKILAEAEKQLRVSNDRATWLTAALLQLGPDRMCMFSASCAGTSVTQSPVALDDLGDNEANDFEPRSSERHAPYHQGEGFMETESSHAPSYHGWEKSHVKDHSLDISCKDSNNDQRLSPTKLDDIWTKVVENCQSLPLQQLLLCSVKLTSMSITEVDATAHLEVCHPTHKSSCDKSQKSIAYLFELVLGFPVEIKTSLAPHTAEEKPVSRSTQVSATQDDGKSQKRSYHQGYERRTQETINRPTLTHQLHIKESFPAIPSPSPQHQHCRASTWQNTAGGSLVYEKATQDLEFLSRKLGGMAYYDQELSGTDISRKGERIMDIAQKMSPHSFEPNVLHNKSRLSQEANLNVHPSQTDAECNQKEANSKMGRHLSIRNRAFSTKNGPHSPNERRSYLTVPRFSITSQTGTQKHRNDQSPKEPSKLSADLEEEEEEVATQKKGKLKGAAGSLARFFQGKQAKDISRR